MSSTKSKLRLAAAFAALLTLALAVSCKGFFVNQPTSVTVTPNSPTLSSGQPENFVAQAAFSDNSTKIVTSSATWTSSNPCIVMIIASGANAGNATDVGTGGSATITASYNGVVGTATATVTAGLTITPCPQTTVGNFPQVLYHVGDSAAFTANGATGTVTWTALPAGLATINSSTGAATFGPNTGTVTITATGNETGTLFVTVQ